MQLVGDLLSVHLVHGPNVVHEVRRAEPTVRLHEEVRGVHEGFAACRFADNGPHQERERRLNGRDNSAKEEKERES